MREGDGRIKYSPQNALMARRCGERALISEKVTQVVWKHGAYVQVCDIHSLTCKEREKKIQKRSGYTRQHRIKNFFDGHPKCFALPAYLIFARFAMKSL